MGDRAVGDDKVILEDTGKDNPAALIATFNGIVMNGWLDCEEFTDATVPIRKSSKGKANETPVAAR